VAALKDTFIKLSDFSFLPMDREGQVSNRVPKNIQHAEPNIFTDFYFFYVEYLRGCTPPLSVQFPADHSRSQQKVKKKILNSTFDANKLSIIINITPKTTLEYISPFPWTLNNTGNN
jgi:hypothetical protein